MDPILYYGVYGQRVINKVINRYSEFVKPKKLYYLVTDHVRKN